jgi:hypothetical protein
MGLFGANFRWLLLEASRRRSSERLLQSVHVLADSDVMVALRVSDTSFRVMEVYKRGPNEDSIRRAIGVWQKDARGVDPCSSPIVSVRRMNIQKSVLKAVMVVRIFLDILLHGFHFLYVGKCKYLYRC